MTEPISRIERSTAHFVTGGDATVTALVVTYNSADSIGGLLDSLRTEAAGTTLRVVVIDNDSADDTAARVHEHPDVVFVDAGGNLGYAAAINLGMERVDRSDAILVLNPDARVSAGCVEALVAAVTEPDVAAVVPLLQDEYGSVSPSLRREPALLATAVDAVLGAYVPRRPRALSETVRDPKAYATPHDIDWATGAALMIDADAARRVGAWDERFFLYSEETDFFRRLRTVGRVRFVPDAVVVHTGAGSGSSQALQNLLSVNKIRYAEMYHGRLWSTAFRLCAVVSEIARTGSASHRATLRVLVDRRRWTHLPSARQRPVEGRTGMGTVIVPAHDEAAVLARTLRPLSDLADRGVVEVIVACNGCTDDTADVARHFPGITVIETSAASKTEAMNAADDIAMFWPRIYLDADVVMTPKAVTDVLTRLTAGAPMSARPRSRYDTGHSSFLVRRYYAARQRLSTFDGHLWGAGCYGLTEEGHRRLGRFPSVVADDVVVDGLFRGDEKCVVLTDPVVISVPRTVATLRTVLSRTYRGNTAVARTTQTSSTFRELLRSVRGPVTAFDAAVYAGFALVGRRAARRVVDTGWARDESSRFGS
ncbi:glycosyltransferase family 2 protein [Rhodococcus sp. SORGH_AS_0303]|uniref:glycosyltransferase family 2 protein n=1 Tax=Rhodococcus sp. SORGH_AS_0303 TaxID=3041753 RepID=UPI00278ABA12|nr:glycosyltransferase family 2 protein [Rhodococcus sp. SORGH_AS_0303]MDQ1199896.1 GT2 family glycosyltransferase [Rhodococcus sp. SORGH_AS_0303]